MPFPVYSSSIFYLDKIINFHIIKRISCRKERSVVFSHIFFDNTEKVSVSASINVMCEPGTEKTEQVAEKEGMARMASASVTVEAVFCIPLFFYAAVCLIWMLEIRAVQTSVRCGMQETGKKLAEEVYQIPVLLPSKVEAEIVNAVGKERLDRSLVVDGSEGLHCERSYMLPGSGIMELKVSYEVRLPFSIFMVPPLKYQEAMRVKGWNGYVRQSFSEPTDRTIVYVTENGVVYHRDYHCTYLEPSVRMVQAEELEELRNENQEKYYPCERCMSGAGTVGMHGAVYISDYGNRYHRTLECSGLKRKVYAVPISEVKGKGACAKCGK